MADHELAEDDLDEWTIDALAAPRDLDAAVMQLEIGLHNSLEGAPQRARELAVEARARGRRELELRCRLVEADVIGRTRSIPAAVELAQGILEIARSERLRVAVARCHSVMADALNRLGARTESLQQAEYAVELLDDSSPMHLVVEHTMALALFTSQYRSGVASFDLFDRSLELANRLAEPILQLAVLHNIAWMQFESGDLWAARASTEELRTVARATGICLNLSMIDTIARLQFELGDPDTAAELLDAALLGPALAPETNPSALPAAYLTKAAILAHQSGPEAARPMLEEARRLAVDRQLLDLEATALRELAGVHAASGEYELAYRTHVMFYERFARLRSSEDGAQAATIQAIYDTQLARRRSREFEQLAKRDPLTGLWNRRYLNDRLPRLIRTARRTGRPLSVAIADLDHFKRVNDKLSHDVGDQVLSATANILRDVVEPEGFVVRFGGEEFLLVLPGFDANGALEIGERIRESMHGYEWQAEAGCWPIRISIGIAALETTGTIASLINSADERLYAAKRQGRDRVLADG